MKAEAGGEEDESAERGLRASVPPESADGEREFTTEEFTTKDTAAAVVAMYTFNFGGGGRDARQDPVQAAELCAGLEGGEEGGSPRRLKG